jgi:hypothetical protein
VPKKPNVNVNKAKVRKTLKLLRSVRCTNFTVIGAGEWGGHKAIPRMPWKNLFRALPGKRCPRT